MLLTNSALFSADIFWCRELMKIISLYTSIILINFHPWYVFPLNVICSVNKHITCEWGHLTHCFQDKGHLYSCTDFAKLCVIAVFLYMKCVTIPLSVLNSSLVGSKKITGLVTKHFNVLPKNFLTIQHELSITAFYTWAERRLSSFKFSCKLYGIIPIMDRANGSI